MGPKTVLTKEEVLHLILWMFHVSAVGLAIKRTQLLDSFQMLLKDIKRGISITNYRSGRR